MQKLSIHADFMNVDVQGRVRLNCIGSIRDFARFGIRLEDGLHVVITDDDDLEADGEVMYSAEEHIWVAKIDWDAIRRLGGLVAMRDSALMFASRGGTQTMNPESATLQLGATCDEVADHEAGHVVIAHVHGMMSRCVLLEDHGNDGFHGRVIWDGAVSGDMMAPARLSYTFAGILAQVKGLAVRHMAEDVTFETEQPWDELARYLRTGNGDPPTFVLRGIRSGKEIKVSARVSSEKYAGDRGNMDMYFQFPPLKQEGALVRILRETAEVLDRPKVWESVRAVAQRLKDLTPTTLIVRELAHEAFADLLKLQ